MVSGSQAVKVTAKAALKNNWLKAIIACSILIFTMFICYNAASVFSIVAGDIGGSILLILGTVFLTCPIALGLLRYYWRILFNPQDNPISVFYYFSDKSLYRRALGLILSLVLRAIFWGILLNIPVLIVNIMSGSFFYELTGAAIPMWTANLTNLEIFLKAVSYVLLFFIMLRYYMAPVLFVADDNMDNAEAMHMSSIISKKTSIDFIYLLFSFFGWILLSIFVVPLGFTLPYILTSYLVHVRFAVAEYNRHIELSAKNSFPSFTV